MSITSPTPARSSSVSPPSLTPSLGWARPRSPLPPHRLAMLANALGVSTPIPANHTPAASPSNPSLFPPASPSSPFPDFSRRSPSPSMGSSLGMVSYSQSTSKFLLHVIPPMHLPHEGEPKEDFDLTPAPASASGYHTQFRRGVMVPMHSSLQSQLGAIAKEYALPSTMGMILYLVNSTPSRSRGMSPSPAPSMDDEEADEPGPRLSEDIWKHLWNRVAQAEREEQSLMASRSNTPNMMGPDAGIHTVPDSPQTSNRQIVSLRPLMSNSRIESQQPAPLTFPLTPMSSSSSSGFPSRSQSKSTASLSQSEPELETPGTSPLSGFSTNLRADSLELPGLHSSSIIPILAKVEFDIDRRKAKWYDPWVRSRKMNHAKRAESQMERMRTLSTTTGGGESEIDEKDGSDEKTAPLELKMGKVLTANSVPRFLTETSSPDDEQHDFLVAENDVDDTAEKDAEVHDTYMPLSESPDEMGSEYSDDEINDDEEDVELQVGSVTRLNPAQDPLADVFGTDADTWADLHADGQSESAPMSKRNSKIVDLALDATALASLPDKKEWDPDLDTPRDEEDIKEILHRMSRTSLSIIIPGTPPGSKNKRRSSPTTAGVSRKHIPPPLVLPPISDTSVVPAGPSPIPPTPTSQDDLGTPSLPYLKDTEQSPKEPLHREGSEGSLEEGVVNEDAEIEMDDQEVFVRIRSPEDDKRGGGVYSDLDLGLDFSEEQEYQNQFLMQSTLDEIEKTLAQFSPRILKSDFPESPTSPGLHVRTKSAMGLPNGGHDAHTLHSRSLSAAPSLASLPLSQKSRSDDDSVPPTPRFPPSLGFGGLQIPAEPKSFELPPEPSTPSWPAVPYASLPTNEIPFSASPSVNSPAPPMLAVNGVSTGAPRQYSPNVQASSSNTISQETEMRKRELAEDEATYSAANVRQPQNSNSPIIPLSPDPFGRFASVPEAGTSRQSGAYWESRDGTPPLVTASDFPLPPVNTPIKSSSSRFSADSSSGSESFTRSANRATLTAVKNISSFLRRSQKSPVSVPPVPPIPSPQLSPATLNQPQERSSVPPVLRSLAPSAAVHPGPASRGRLESPLDKFHFDQESPYPKLRSPSLVKEIAQLTPSFPISQTPLSASSSRRPSNAPPPKTPPPEAEKGARKSILKSWNSRSSLSNKSTGTPDPLSKSSLEQSPPLEAPKQRRPSIIGALRAPVSSPDVPEVPQRPQLSSRPSNGRLNDTPASSDLTNQAQHSRGPSLRASPPRSVKSIGSPKDVRPSLDAVPASPAPRANVTYDTDGRF